MIERHPQHSAAAFIASKSSEDIAKQLHADDTLFKNGNAYSWVALHAPASGTPEAIKIAQCLTPSPDYSTNIKRMLYENIVSRLRTHLNSKGVFATQREIDNATKDMQAAQLSLGLSSERIRIALEVLEVLQQNAEIGEEASPKEVCSLLTQKLAGGEKPPTACTNVVTTEQSTGIPEPPIRPRKRMCYICRLALTVAHPTQPAMCMPCGTFNLASSRISEPSRLTLPPTFTALVTGARINLGYHTALRLLRCGARVLATTRYPRDAVARYAREGDFSVWKDRLRILGADFRCAADVFALVEDTRRCLRDGGGAGRLHLLINNAAQTLTDSVRKEERAIERETSLLGGTENSVICGNGSYEARVRGGGLLMALGGVERERGRIENGATNGPPTPAHAALSRSTTPAETEPSRKSSWVQRLSEIPYEDVISAHSVNTFVPLILTRELLPLMGNPRVSPDGAPASTKPAGYIVNVSSREGIFEARTGSSAKAGTHVHTNMSKAALNMITETESVSAWRETRVAMNTVDPGYMSAAPEYEEAFGGTRPIGWEDGAGRVLWAVAVGELEGRAVWGRFLKHYGAVEVDPGAGRG